MHAWRLLRAASIGAALAVLAARAGAPDPAFEKMKALVGDWEGATEHGKVEVSYRLVSGGTVLMSEIRMPDMPGHDMMTMIHPDGSRVLLTHYCADNNQPRMVSRGLSADGKTVEFAFLDATNLASLSAGHMDHVAYRFTDADHYTEVWTWKENGTEAPHPFEMTRKK
jgi:hypothetical protein